MSTKIENALYHNQITGKEEILYFNSLDTELYESLYKGKLTCINGCDAKIKFTQRKNNKKFFSTWNGDGNKHSKYCQYHVMYKGKNGRKRLEKLFENEELSDERIQETVLRKIKSLKELHKEIVKNIPQGSKKTETSGSGVEGTRAYINSLDARNLDSSFIGTRKCVYGKVNNIQIETDKSGEKYAYLNLNNPNHSVSVYLSQAFYSSENNNVKDFEKYIRILQEAIALGKELVFIGVGKVEKKKKQSGVNVKILNKLHFVVNEETYDHILIDGKVNSTEIDI